MRSSLASVGIIGGADGPTAIIVSGPPLLDLVVMFAVLAVVVVAIVILVRHFRKKK